MKKPEKTPFDLDFPNDGPEYDPEMDNETIELPEDVDAKLLELIKPPKRRSTYGDEDQDDLMDMIDKHTD